MSKNAGLRQMLEGGLESLTQNTAAKHNCTRFKDIIIYKKSLPYIQPAGLLRA